MIRATFRTRLLAVFTMLMAVPAVSMAQNNKGAAPKAAAAGKTMDVEALNDNIAQYTGQKVSVAGEVEERVGPRSFILESGGIFDDEITVVIPPDVMGQQALPREDAELVVTGTVRAMSLVEMERELGWDLSPELEVEFEGVKHFLVADSIAPRRR